MGSNTLTTSSPKQLKGKLSVITGASSGIGKATALKFAEAGSDLLLLARREDRLNEVKKICEDKYGVDAQIIAIDLKNFEELIKTLEKLPEKFHSPDILINNAGMVRGLSKLWEVKPEEWDEMIDINIKSILYLCRFFIPFMIKKKKGHIVNLGSIASHYTYPGGTIYCGTKHAVLAINDALRMELVDTPIRVSLISPGMVETEFSEVRFYGDKSKAKDVYKGITPLTAEDIAEALLFMVTRPPHVNIVDLQINPQQQASVSTVYRK